MLNNNLFEIDGTTLVKYSGNEKNVKIPDGIMTIGNCAFKDNKNIVSIEFSQDVIKIGRMAFEGCENLRCLTLNSNLKIIEQGAFSQCIEISIVIYHGTIEDWCRIEFYTPISNKYSLIINNQLLVDLHIPKSVLTIPMFSFSGCRDISRVFVPSNTTIIEDAFSYCNNITDIIIDEKNTRYSFVDGCLVDLVEQSVIYGTSYAKIPSDSNIKKISNSAFKGCKNLEEIVVPCGVSMIGAEAFKDCKSLSDVYILSGIKCIEYSTFSGCKMLESIHLPVGIEKIENNAFGFCENLKEISLPEGLVEIGEFVFCGDLNINKMVFPKSLKCIEFDLLSPFEYAKIDKICYRGGIEDWEDIKVVDSGVTKSIEDIISCDVVYNYIDKIDLYQDEEHCGNIIVASGLYVEFNCETEECTIEFGDVFNLVDHKVRVWIKDIGVRTTDGEEEIIYEYFPFGETEENWYMNDCSLTISDSKFNNYYLTPCYVNNNPYDEEFCCSELFFTLVVDLGDHDIEMSDWVVDCDEIEVVGEYDEIGYDVGNRKFQTTDILYIYKGNVRCHKYHHEIIQATAILHSKTDSEIEINVEYCKDCDKYLLEYNLFEEYRNRYGVLIGNFRMVVNGNFDGEYDLALESPLKLSGYNVGQKDGFSSAERHYILARIIHDGIMSKGDVIRYLSYFIRMNGAKSGNELAVSKWREDLAFAQSYNIAIQPRTIISDIRRY